MMQLSLFPRPGALQECLPDDVLVAARAMLAELLIAVAEEDTEQEPTGKGGVDE
jgi:hypothetical protein